MIHKLLPVFAVLAVLGAYWIGHTAGETAMRSEVQQQYRERMERAIEQEEDLRAQEREILMHGFEVRREVETRTQTIVKEVDRVETPECTALGDSWRRLFNDAVGVANRAGEDRDSGASAPAVPPVHDGE